MTDERMVSIEPLREGDAEQLFAWINNRATVIWNAGFRPVHEATHVAWFAAVQRRTDMAIFAIRTRPGNGLIGTCQLHSIDPVHRSAELQIRIGAAEARGQGFGTDALRLLLGFGFADLNLERVHLHVFADNRRAIAAYERVGFVHEGMARRAAFVDGRYRDVVLMGMLRSDFASGGCAS